MGVTGVEPTSFPGSLSYPSLSLAPLERVGENPGNEVGVEHETRDKRVARGRKVVEGVGLV